jgi:hypothetical protein
VDGEIGQRESNLALEFSLLWGRCYKVFSGFCMRMLVRLRITFFYGPCDGFLRVDTSCDRVLPTASPAEAHDGTGVFLFGKR